MLVYKGGGLDATEKPTQTTTTQEESGSPRDVNYTQNFCIFWMVT